MKLSNSLGRKVLAPIAGVLVAFSAAQARADDGPVLVPIQRLTLDYAVVAAQAALADCRKQGMNISVAVVDRGGTLQVLLRDTLAMPISADIAEQKAYAALNFNAPTSQIQDRFTSPFSPGKLEGLILSAGAVPITAAGNIVGAIGVSGAPSGTVDEACAQSGLDAIGDDLQMAL